MSSPDGDRWGVVDEEANGGEDEEASGGVGPDLGPGRAGPLAVVVWVACYLGFLYAFTPTLGTVEIPVSPGESAPAVPLAPLVGLLVPFPIAGAVYGALTGEGGLRGGARVTVRLFVDGLSLAGEMLAGLGTTAFLGLSILYLLGWLGNAPAASYLPGDFLPLWVGSGVAALLGGLLHWLHLQLAAALGVEPRRSSSAEEGVVVER